MKSNKKTKKGEVDKESLKKKIKEIFESNKTQTFNYKQISASLGITKKEERINIVCVVIQSCQIVKKNIVVVSVNLIFNIIFISIA